MNLFLYIIWSTAYYKKQEILEDIGNTFDIQKVIEVEWTKDKFAENLSRFYGQKLPRNSFKEKACGTDPFTLVVVEDKNPVYEMRLTSRGDQERVNIHAFDKKTLYRKWTTPETGKKHSRIHGTNSIEETEHDLTLLLGMSPEEFVEKKDSIPDKWCHDIVGAEGWESLEQLFYVLNHTCRYVVLRNFENMPHSFHLGPHADIDLLSDSFEEIKRITNGKSVFSKKYRVQCMVDIDGQPTQFDFRFVGDEYYDINWEKHILENRKMQNGVYVPNEEEYKYMILYHALIHKRVIAEDYVERLDQMFGHNKWDSVVLKEFLDRMNYKFTEPVDYSVYYNDTFANTGVSNKRKFVFYYRWIANGIKKRLGLKKC